MLKACIPTKEKNLQSTINPFPFISTAQRQAKINHANRTLHERKCHSLLSQLVSTTNSTLFSLSTEREKLETVWRDSPCG